MADRRSDADQDAVADPGASGERVPDDGAEPVPDDGADPTLGDGTEPDPVSRYAVSAEATEVEFLSAAKLYARAVAERHDLTVSVADLEWDVSKRARRRAGVVKHVDGEPERVTLTWEHFQTQGWTAAAGTIRHELAHVHLLNEAGDPSHGEAFRELADELDAPRHCERFSDPEWWVICTDCDARLARYRRSKLVREPENYRCGGCGGSFRVEEAE